MGLLLLKLELHPMIDNYIIFKLLKLNGIGNVSINKIFLEIGDDLQLSFLENILSKKGKLEEWSNLDELECSNEYKNIIDSNVKLVTLLSEEYPKQLKKTLGISAPAILYYKGNVSLFNQPSISVIGSRNASTEAINETKEICGILASEGFNIVSGYAKGIDRTAHISAIDNEGTTSIVLPTGMYEFKMHKDVSLTNKETDWLVLSEFPCASVWSGSNAMTRNKTIIGLSSAVIVMESGPQKDEKGRMSGTYNSASQANKFKIPLLVLSSDIVSAEGNKTLISNGAQEVNSKNCLEKVKNIIKNLNLNTNNNQSTLF